MRVSNWNAKGIFAGIANQAFKNAEVVMDDVVAQAKLLCPVGTITRAGKPGSKAWTERKPGSLKNSIRRVSRSDKANIRAYAGNYEVYYARFVEVGTVKMTKHPFLRPPFQEVKSSIIKRIKDGR